MQLEPQVLNLKTLQLQQCGICSAVNKNKLSESDLKKIKELFDNQSETQDDVFESSLKKNKSVIIWAMDSFDFVKEKPGNTYNIKVEFRSGSDGDYNDETIESFEVNKGTQKKDIDTLQKATDLFFKNGGKKIDLIVTFYQSNVQKPKGFCTFDP